MSNLERGESGAHVAETGKVHYECMMFVNKYNGFICSYVHVHLYSGGEERFIKPQNRKEAGDNWYTGRSGSWNRTRKDMRAYGSKGGGRGEKFSDKKQEPKGADIKEKIDTRVSREKDVSVKEVENSTTVTEKPKEESTQSKGVSEDQLHEVIEQVNQDPEQVHKNQDVSSEDNHVAQRNDSKEVNVESENKLTVEQSKEQNAARWRGRGRGMREKLGLPKVGSINKKGDSHLEEARDEKGSLQAASKPKRYSSQRQKGKDGEQGTCVYTYIMLPLSIALFTHACALNCFLKLTKK